MANLIDDPNLFHAEKLKQLLAQVVPPGEQKLASNTQVNSAPTPPDMNVPTMQIISQMGGGGFRGVSPAEKQDLAEIEQTGKRNLESLQGDVSNLRDQTSMAQYLAAHPIRDMTPTITTLLNIAGKKNDEAVAAATPESNMQLQKNLREALQGAIKGQDTLADDQLSLLKTKLGYDKSLNDSKMLMGQDSKMNDMFTKYGQAIDPAHATSRNGLGKPYQALLGIQRAEALANSKSDPNQMIPQQVRELNEAVANVIIGGGAGNISEGRVNELAQNTLGMDFARAVQYAEANPTAANAGEFVKQLQDLLSREKGVIQGQVQQGQMNAYRTYAPILLGSPRHAVAAQELARYHGLPIDSGGQTPSVSQPSGGGSSSGPMTASVAPHSLSKDEILAEIKRRSSLASTGK